MNTFTVSFFGHREVENFAEMERRLDKLIRDLMTQKEYVEFLVGRNGEFDQLAASTVLKHKQITRGDNSSLVLILPYMTAEFANNQKSFYDYYDEIEISEAASDKHFKAAIQVRNREMTDRSDEIICYITRKSGGAFQTVQYAKRHGRKIVNIAEEISRDRI